MDIPPGQRASAKPCAVAEGCAKHAFLLTEKTQEFPPLSNCSLQIPSLCTTRVKVSSFMPALLHAYNSC